MHENVICMLVKSKVEFDDEIWESHRGFDTSKEPITKTNNFVSGGNPQGVTPRILDQESIFEIYGKLHDF